MSIFSKLWEGISGVKRDENKKKDPQSRKARMEALEERQLLTVAPGAAAETALVAEAFTVTNEDALVTAEALDDASPVDDVYFVANESNDAPVTVDATGDATSADDVVSVANESSNAKSVSYLYYENGQSKTGEVTNYTVVTTSTTVWTGGWYVVDHDVTINESVRCDGQVNLILVNGYTLTVKGQYGKAGIEVKGGGSNSLTVYGQSTEETKCGVLKATGGHDGAGIGSNQYEFENGNITINSGRVVAVGGTGGGAGIGGGSKSRGAYITINGGYVEASSQGQAAGIGGGWHGDGTDIKITGGKVTAKGGDHGAGIGGGCGYKDGDATYGSGSSISITGGTVIATGGDYGAGIGGGFFGIGCHITIENGYVEAKCGGLHAAGIGGGCYGEGHTITISNGTVKATGGHRGAGIGGGQERAGDNITISGGTVTATGGGFGAGIGGGARGGLGAGEGYKIYITGGNVTATGGFAGHKDGDGAGAGIGGGYKSDGHDIEISGAATVVNATGGNYAAGIGGGTKASGYKIKINNGTVTARGGWLSAGIGGGNATSDREGGKGSEIYIYGGTVNAYGNYGAGIGGGNYGEGYKIYIYGGTVNAYGSGGNEDGSAGIGGGSYGKGSQIYIYGGTVFAQGGSRGAGIGSGYNTKAENIFIKGGDVTAKGIEGGAGIGGGSFGSGYYITISGGKVTATSSTKIKWNGNEGGAGIGGGYKGEGAHIKIEGSAEVTATGGEYGAGIGAGGKKDGSNIIIQGNAVVEATGGMYAAGIGGGGSSNGSFTGSAGNGTNIKILGGNVLAKGGFGGGAGIGGGNAPLMGARGKGRDIKIENAIVEAWGGILNPLKAKFGCSIGDGNGKQGENITVSQDSIVKTGTLLSTASVVVNTGGDLARKFAERQKAFILPKKISTPVVKVTSTTESSITIAWNEDDRAKDYEVAFRANENDKWTVVAEHQDEETYEFSDLESNTTYYFRVKANAKKVSVDEEYITSEYAYAKGTTAPSTLTGVSIDGRACVGETLTATVAPEGATADYVWYRLNPETGASEQAGTGKTYTVQDKDYGYVLQVKATGNGKYGGEVFSEKTEKVMRKLATPADFKVSGTSDVSITVEWKAVDKAKGYVVEYSLNTLEKSWKALDETTALNQVVDGLARNTEYVIRVKALATDESGYVDSNYAETYATTAKTALTGVSITGTAKVGETLTATVEPNGADVTYEWYRSGVLVQSVTGATYKVTTADVGFSLTVKAIGTEGFTGVVTSKATSVVPKVQLATPGNFKVDNTTDSTITVSWNKVDNADRYEVQYSVKGTKDWKTVDAKKALTLTIKDLSRNTTYRVRVQAIGKGAYSDSEFTGKDATTEKTALTEVKINGTVAVDQTLTATVVPTDASKAVTYAWYRSGFPASVGSDATYKVTLEDVGAFLTVKATATGDFTGEVSANTSVVPKAKVAEPENFRVVATTDSSITVSWNVVDNATGYKVKYRAKNDVTKAWSIVKTTDTTLEAKNLTRNTEYVFQVKALGSDVYDASEFTKMSPNPKTAKTELESVSISGTVAVGETLTAAVDPTDASVTYAWYRSGKNESIGSGATYKVTTADSGCVLTVKATGTGDYTGEVSASTSYVPQIQLAKPKKFQVIATTDSSITVSWKAVENASGYKVEYRVNDGSKGGWAEFDVQDTTFKIDGLTCNTKYRVRVKAVGTGAYSDSEYTGKNATTLQTTLKSVSIYGTVAVGETLTATVEPEGATATYVWYRANTQIGTGETYAVTSADVGAVLTVKATGTGDYTGEVSAKTSDVPKVKLATPENFKVDRTTDSSITVSWSAVENAVGYRVEYRVKGTEGKWAGFDAQEDTTLTIKALDRNTTYRVRVKAIGSGAYSESDFVGEFATTAQTALTSVSIDGTLAVGQTLTASVAPKGATANYAWYRNGVGEPLSTNATYQITLDDVGSVLTVKATGTGDYTGEVTRSTEVAVPKVKLATPENFKATAESDAVITVSWNAVTGASGYQVEYKEKSASVWNTREAQESFLNVDGLKRSTDYEFKVKALGSETYADSDYATTSAKTASESLTSVSISGTAKVGEKLTATVAPTGATANYTWYRANTQVGTGATYTVTTADVGFALTVKATGTGEYVGEVSASTEKVSQVQLAKPKKFTVTGVTDSTISVSWKAVENASGYKVEYRVKGDSTSDWADVETQGTTCTIERLARNTTYRVRVKALGTGAYSDSDYAKTDATTARTALTSVSINGTVAVGETLTATVAPNDATATYVWYRANTQVGTGATYKITNKDGGAVLTVKATGTDDFVGQVSASTEEVPTTKLATPGNFQASGTTDSSISVSWSAVDNAKGYKVEYRVKGSEEKWQGFETQDASATINGLTRNTTYRVRVKALGSGVYSDSAFVGLDATTAQTALTSVAINGTLEVGQTLTATAAPNGATANYEWYRNGVGEILSTGATYQVTIYDVGYVLIAKATGNGDYTGEVTASTSVAVPKVKLATPENFKATVESDAAISISWNVVANATGYQVGYREKGASTWNTNTTKDLFFRVDGLKRSTEYEFQVKALGSETYAESDYATTSAKTASEKLAEVSIKGKAEIGQTLTATGLLPEGATATYYWTRSGEEATIGQGATYTVVGADAGHELTVTAVGYGDFVGKVSASTAEVPFVKLATPEGFMVTGKTDDSITFEWKAVEKAIGYKLEYKDAKSDWTILDAQGTTLKVDGLARNTQYTFRLKAVGAAGYTESDYTKEEVVSTEKTLVTSVSLSGTAKVGETLTATGLTPAGAAVSYEWYRSEVAESIGKGETYVVTTDDVGHTLMVKAVGIDDYMGTVESSKTDVVPAVQLPMPTNFKIDETSTVSVTVSWDKVENADKYEVGYVKIGSESSGSESTVTATRMTFISLTPGTTYAFYVRALGSGAYSNSEYAMVKGTTDFDDVPFVTTAEEDVIPTGIATTNAWNLSGFVGVVAPVTAVEVAQVKAPTIAKPGKIAESSDVRSEIFATLAEDEFDALDLDVAFDALV